MGLEKYSKVNNWGMTIWYSIAHRYHTLHIIFNKSQSYMCMHTKESLNNCDIVYTYRPGGSGNVELSGCSGSLVRITNEG